jgi:hypothetical protein
MLSKPLFCNIPFDHLRFGGESMTAGQEDKWLTTEIDPLLTDFRLFAMRKHLQIML